MRVEFRADKAERRLKQRQNSRLCYCVRRESDWLLLAKKKSITSINYLTLPYLTGSTKRHLYLRNTVNTLKCVKTTLFPLFVASTPAGLAS